MFGVFLKCYKTSKLYGMALSIDFNGGTIADNLDNVINHLYACHIVSYWFTSNTFYYRFVIKKFCVIGLRRTVTAICHQTSTFHQWFWQLRRNREIDKIPYFKSLKSINTAAHQETCEFWTLSQLTLLSYYSLKLGIDGFELTIKIIVNSNSFP